MACETEYITTRLPRPKTFQGTETTALDQAISNPKRSQSASQLKNLSQSSLGYEPEKIGKILSSGRQLEQSDDPVTEKHPVHGYDEPESVSTRKEAISHEGHPLAMKTGHKLLNPTEIGGEASRRTPKSCSDYQSLPTGSDNDGDDEIDVPSLIDSLPEIEDGYKPVPEELSERIYELCDKFGVENADWIQKSTDWRTILILGKGVDNEELKKQLVDAEYQFEFVESGPSHVTHLSSSYPQVCESFVGAPEDSPPTEASTGQLILEGEKNGHCEFYVATAAHLILTLAQCRIFGEENITRTRREVQARFNAMKYKLVPQAGPSLRLDASAMFAYREGRFTLQFGNAEHRTDLAIFRLTQESISVLKNLDIPLNTQRDFPFQRLLKIIPDNIRELRNNGKVVYIHERECRVTGGISGRGDDHIKFILVQGNPPLQPGDSGSVLYMRTDDNKWPIGMLVSRYPADPKTYLAIMLKPAVGELRRYYRDGFTVLKVINVEERFRQPRRTRPPP